MSLKRITTARAEGPCSLRVAWEDGVERTVDLAALVRAYKAYAPLLDERHFRQAKPGEHGWTVDFGDDLEIPSDQLARLAQEQAGEAMPALDFQAWRARHRLSLSGAAQLLGLSRRMVAYYDSGERIIPKTVMLACRGAFPEDYCPRHAPDAGQESRAGS